MKPTPNARTIQSYEQVATEYARQTEGQGVLAGALERLAETVPAGQVLEIGSGPGWDADRLEDAGLTVRRTDVTRAFIELQRARGKEVDRLDVIGDDLGGPYDAIVMLHVLQHVESTDLPSVLAKVARALRPDGWFLVSIPQGHGEGWETGASGSSYYRALRSRDELVEALGAAGLRAKWSDQARQDDGWLVVLAGRAEPTG